jgi:uncharacterized membrane protein
LSGDSAESADRRYVSTARLEAFSDGVFAIAITLLVLDLAIGSTGDPLHRVLDAWPYYLAYLVSFLTIGAAWLGHNAMTDALMKADASLLRVNLLVLFFVSLLPFPTRLVAGGIHNAAGERVFVTMYGITVLAIRLALFAMDEYCRREHLYEARHEEDEQEQRKLLLPTATGYVVAIVIGIAVPLLAIVLYCLVAVVLVVPFRTLARLVFRRP